MSEEFQYPKPSKKSGKRSPKWFAQNIRALREHMGMTQRQMADELQVRQQTISEWETGIHTPHRSTQKALSYMAERAEFTYQVEPQKSDAATAASQDQSDSSAATQPASQDTDT